MKLTKRLPFGRLAFLTGLALLVALPAQAETRSLKNCTQEAVKSWNLLKAADHDIKSQENDRDSIRGNFLPKLRIESNLMFWDQRRDMTFPISDKMKQTLQDFNTVYTDLAPSLQLFLSSDASKQAFANLNTSLAGLTSYLEGKDKLSLGLIHKDVTWTNKLVVAQPLVQLYQVYSGYKAGDEKVASARAQKQESTHEVELNVAKAYYGLITAVKTRGTIEAAIKQVEAIEKQVEAYLAQELVEKNALMKVKVQKADLQKSLFMAEKGEKIARSTINMLMGRPLDEAWDPEISEANDLENDPMLAQALNNQQNRALEKRPDLLSVRHLTSAANFGKHAAISALLPDLNAVFLYEFQKGVGTLTTPETQYYGGLQLTWNFWEWGASYYKIKEAEETEAKAHESAKALEASIRLDVQTKRLELEEALKVLDVAKASLVQAKENLRIEQARYDVQETTTTDLLQAQTLSVQAENDNTVAEMKVLQARLTLKSSMGESLL